MKKRLIALFVTLLLLLPLCAPAAAEADQTQALLNGLLHAEQTRTGAADLQQWVDTALAASMGTGGEWYALGLSRLQPSHPCDLAPLRAALVQALAEGGVQTAATRQTLALCLLAAGGSEGVGETADGTIGQQGIMSWIFGLHLLNNGYPSSLATGEEAAAQLCAMQLEGGGWALMGKTADPDVTAMALQALAPHRHRPEVGGAVERALHALAEKQLPDGGYASMGAPNPESAAQVLIALCALEIDPLKDARFIKNGHTLPDSFASYALPDGSYSHTPGGAYSANATQQVFLGLAAHQLYAAGQGSLYLLPHLPEQTGEAPLPAGRGEAASVGIIGGADGPTVILVSGVPGWKLAAAAVILLAGLLTVLVQLIRGRRSRKHWLPPLLLALAAVCLLFCLDIQTPETYYGSDALPEGQPIGTVTMQIRCDTLPAGTENLPPDGVILPETAFPLWQGDTVYDLLTRAARQNRLQLDTSGAQGMMYVSAIQYLYEQAHGELSGWMYLVNGASSSKGCDQYTPMPGDSILWAYTCDMGADLQ